MWGGPVRRSRRERCFTGRRRAAGTLAGAREANLVVSARILPGRMSTNQRGERMVAEQLRTHGITDERVLQVMAELPREEFVPAQHRRIAYADHPLTIGGGQTISQPLVVAAMTQAANPRAEDRALEAGAASGYQLPVLARVCRGGLAAEGKTGGAVNLLGCRIGFGTCTPSAGKNGAGG